MLGKEGLTAKAGLEVPVSSPPAADSHGWQFACRRSVTLRVLIEVEAQLPRGPEETHLDRRLRRIENLANAS